MRARAGDIVLVRMVVNNIIEGSDAVQCRVHNPKSNLYAFVPVAPSEIVSIEHDEQPDFRNSHAHHAD